MCVLLPMGLPPVALSLLTPRTAPQLQLASCWALLLVLLCALWAAHACARL
jgi:hypothetical protein